MSNSRFPKILIKGLSFFTGPTNNGSQETESIAAKAEFRTSYGSDGETKVSFSENALASNKETPPPAYNAKTLISLTMDSKPLKVEDIVEHQPELAKKKAEVIDRAGRIFTGSAFQYAVWAGDKMLQDILQEKLSAEEQKKQLTELDNTPTYILSLAHTVTLDDNTLYIIGVEEKQLSYLVRTISDDIVEGSISESELDGHTLSNVEDLKNELKSLLPTILKITTKRKHTIGHGPRFDATPLIEAYQACVNNYQELVESGNTSQLEKLLLEVSRHQFFMPINWWYEFFRKDRPLFPAPKDIGKYQAPACQLTLDSGAQLLTKNGLLGGLGRNVAIARESWRNAFTTNKIKPLLVDAEAVCLLANAKKNIVVSPIKRAHNGLRR